jgi:SAM-dependent methyltransferase
LLPGELVSTSPLCFDPYVVNNVIGHRFLDIGCGYGKWGFLLKKYRWSAEDGTPFVAGVDAFAPHVESLKKQNIYDEVLVASALQLPFEDRSFDSTIACEVLEHLPREEGMRLIGELKRVSRHCFVVTTPNYACLRGGGETADGFNEHEAHQYNYSYREFCALGFTQVIGLGRMQLPSWQLGAAAASLGLYFPRKSRFLMGFWFADGKKRPLFAE